MKPIRHCCQFFILAILLILLSCDQASIFYNISMEPPPLTPFVGGSPTNMVVIGNTLFVGSINNTRIFYHNSGQWYSTNTPGNRPILALAGYSSRLAILMEVRGSGRMQMELVTAAVNTTTGVLSDFVTVSVPAPHNGFAYNIQSIYGAGARLYIGAQRMESFIDGNNASRMVDVYSIFYVDAAGPASTLLRRGERIDAGNNRFISDTGLLTGAAVLGANAYLSTLSGYIYRVSTGTPGTPFSMPADGSPISGRFTGIINSGSAIIAVSDNGNSGSVYVVSGDAFEANPIPGPIFTGALAIQTIGTSNTLLLGVRATGTSTVQGYRTLDLTGGRPAADAIIGNPGAADAVLRASIGVRPVLSILQVPNTVLGIALSEWTGELLFAATSQSGLWSNRERNGVTRWNAETYD